MPRQRQFDDHVVLDHAASVFWRHGYAGIVMILATRVLARLNPEPPRLGRSAEATLAGLYPPIHSTAKK
jgi:hypothetical protein